MAIERSGAVGPEVFVSLEYQLFDGEGELIEAPGPDEAIEFIFGVGQGPPAIESAIDGLRVGQRRRLSLNPEQAFGERDEEAVISVDASELPPGTHVGEQFEAERDDGQTIFLRVVAIEEDVAHLDANHPLAGQTITLELCVLETRIASSEELRLAAEELAERGGLAEPDVLISQLIRRDRSVPGSA